ncbi:DUF2474 domain-containing protein [Sphingomonas echinoides]|nr:DUF2474 domain-containing protein [Sphingomonas echinoides]
MPGSCSRPLWRRIGWMLLIWLGSVLALGAVSLVIRFWLHA